MVFNEQDFWILVGCVGGMVAELHGASSPTAAVYAVRDREGTTRFVGSSRNVGLALEAQAAAMPERVVSVRVLPFPTADRAKMEQMNENAGFCVASG